MKNSNKCSSYNELRIYAEVSEMAKELRRSVKQMCRYDRFDVGDQIREILRDIKCTISDAFEKPNEDRYEDLCTLVNHLNHLEIFLSDCLEDESLSLSGHFGISSPIQRLGEIKNQAHKWKSYVYDSYGKKSDSSTKGTQ